MAAKTDPSPVLSIKRQRITPRPLEVHIVEDHGDVLELLYDSIGAKRTPFSNLDWVHFDSHPDLALPAALCASTVQDPPTLYEVIEDSAGGNAEFILPAVFAGHVSTVCWVRPPWAKQLPDGVHRFQVGAEKSSACLRVTLPAVYYLDEGLHCPLEEMESETASTLELRVCLVENTKTFLPARPAAEAGGGWLLDICLDYYSTENPFLAAVEKVAGIRTRETVRAFFEASLFRQEGEREVTPEVVKHEIATFLRLTNELTEIAAASSASPSPETSERERVVMEAFRPLLVPAHEADDALPVVTAFAQLLRQGGAALVDSVRRLGGHCACLPSHQSSWEEMEAMIRATAKAVEALCQAHGAPPSIVLMARSARDGYTPLSIVDALQEKVLEALGGVQALGPLRVVTHYTDEEVEEGSVAEKEEGKAEMLDGREGGLSAGQRH